MARNQSGRRTGGRLVLFIFGQIIKWIFLILLTIVLLGAVTALFVLNYAKTYVEDEIIPQAEEMQTTLDLQAYDPNLSSTIYYYDKNAETYVEMETLYATENRKWVEYEDIPENLINATVAIEDKRFWEHNGVDWRRTLSAVYYMFTGGNVQGGSTITQQLIKNLSDNDDVTVKRKVLEIFAALEFDKNHTKEETLELYLNNIYLGRLCNGIYTASYKYFGKDVSELDLAECASLISITNNPSIYDPYNHPENNHKRACAVITQMYEQGYITEQEERSALAEIGYYPDGTDEEGNTVYTYDEDKVTMVFTDGSLLNEESDASSVYSWYTDAVIDSVLQDLMDEYGYTKEAANNVLFCGGLSIYTCYDPEAQAAVDEVYQNTDWLDSDEYKSKTGQSLQSSITVVDNSTGAVVALSQIGEKTSNRSWVQATRTLRQPGSSIKPLSVYAPALEEGLITPYSGVDDSPFMEVNGEPWPSNSSHSYSGWTNIYTSVIKSLNTSAVKTLDLLGVEKSFEYLEDKFGISSLVSYYEGSDGTTYSDIDYAPLALGGLTEGVSTFEMAGAYSTFPRDGIYIEPHLYTSVVDSDGNTILSNEEEGTRILSEKTAYYMNTMLCGVVSSGTGTAAQIEGYTVAGKTGTTSKNYDRWFCGYSGYYTAAVWIGYTSSEHINFSGNPATLLWQQVMSNLIEGKPDIDLTETNLDIVSAYYCTKSGDLATSACSLAGCAATGYYVAGDEPTSYCSLHTTIKVCIESPIDGYDSTDEETARYHMAGEYCPEESVIEIPVIAYGSSEYTSEYDESLAWYREQGECTKHTQEWSEHIEFWSQQVIQLASTSYSKTIDDPAFNLGAYSEDLEGNPGGTLSYSSGNTAVAEVDSNGNITIVGVGTATITITADKTEYADPVTATVTITVSESTAGSIDEFLSGLFGGGGSEAQPTP